jgi:hypothetical protein
MVTDRRYLVDRDFNSFRASVPAVVRRAMELSLLTEHGLVAVLAIRWRDVETIGIARERWKVKVGGIRNISPKRLPITPALKGVLKACRVAGPDLPREYVLRLKDGYPLSVSDFNQIWNVYMRRWVARGEIRLAFSFADIRKKALADKNRRGVASVRRGH